MRRQKFLTRIIAVMIVLISLTLASSAWAAEYKTLHKFKQTGVRGLAPYGGLIFDAAGNLYGTTAGGGVRGNGTVFELTPNGDGSWVKRVLYSFRHSDGRGPHSSLIFDAAGNLYGTAFYGGSGSACGRDGCGTIFQLAPNADGSWAVSVLHSFNGSDGAGPYGGLTFDADGNLYGATAWGGADGLGVAFELTPNGDGSWGESVLHSFSGSEGGEPLGRMIFDAAGNLYGTTYQGGAHGNGTVFELTPNGDGSWVESLLHSFNGSDGGYPFADLTFDAAGNLYGTTKFGGHYRCTYGCGTVFKLTPNGDGSWVESVLHLFNGSDGRYPVGGLTFDAAGNLYGTTLYGGGSACCHQGRGTVFKLTPNGDGSWTQSVLHRFIDRPGAWPNADLVPDQTGNLYGTTVGDGKTTFGSVFEITP